MGFFVVFGVIVLVAVVALIIWISNKESVGALITSIVATVIAIILWVVVSATTVETGQVAVPTKFGKIVDQTLEPGLHFIAPWYSAVVVSNSREQIEFNSSQQNVIISKDKLEMGVAVAHPYMINSKHVHVLLKIVGTTSFDDKVKSILQTCGDNAVRYAFSTFNGAEAAGAKKDTLEVVLSDRFAKNVAIQLQSMGASKEVAAEVFNFAPSLVKRAVLPGRITREIAELQATQYSQQRKDIELVIARKEAEIAATDGGGVRSFLDQLGIRSATPYEISLLMNANAALNYSEGFQKAVEGGKIGSINLSSLPLVTPANK